MTVLLADAVSLAYGESEMSFEMFEENVCYPVYAILCLCEDTTVVTDNFIYRVAQIYYCWCRMLLY